MADIAQTNAQLAAQINALLQKWNAREAEFRDWLGGDATGGPNGDGKFPLTDASGRTILVPSPALLADTVEGPAGLSREAQVSSEAARDEARGHRDQAAADAAVANASRSAAQDAKNLAKQYRDDAAAHAAGLSSARTAAESAAENAALARDAATEARDTTLVARDDSLVARADAVLARDQAQSFAASIDPTKLATKAELATEIAALVDSSPEALNTLNEFAQALGNDPNFATTITNQLAGKAPLVHRHGLSEIDGLQTALDGKQPVGSYATLGADGKVTASQLPALNYLPLSGGTLSGNLLIQRSDSVTAELKVGTTGTGYTGGSITMHGAGGVNMGRITSAYTNTDRGRFTFEGYGGGGAGPVKLGGGGRGGFNVLTSPKGNEIGRAACRGRG